jgi:hypothetical protein
MVLAGELAVPVLMINLLFVKLVICRSEFQSGELSSVCIYIDMFLLSDLLHHLLIGLVLLLIMRKHEELCFVLEYCAMCQLCWWCSEVRCNLLI